MKLIPLLTFNSMVKQQRAWAPFRRGANGLACPLDGSELVDVQGEEVFIREDKTKYRNVKCEKKDCEFVGVREML